MTTATATRSKSRPDSLPRRTVKMGDSMGAEWPTDPVKTLTAKLIAARLNLSCARQELANAQCDLLDAIDKTPAPELHAGEDAERYAGALLLMAQRITAAHRSIQTDTAACISAEAALIANN